MPDTTTQNSKFAVLYCEDDAKDRTKFSDNHKNSEFDVSVCGDIEALPHMLAVAERVPDLLVLDLYHSRYSPDSPEAERAAEETKIIEGRLAAILEEVKENANRHYEARAVSILKELRKQPKLRDVPVLLYTRQGMLGITDEELHEVSDYGAEWMLKGRKLETERRRMHNIIARAHSRKSEGKKVVFLSHAWEDRAIVQPFKDAFFGPTNSLLDQSKYEWFYTSDPLDPSIPLGEHMWQKIEKTLLRCEHFVVFCSPNYFKSQTCQNELGAFKALNAIANQNPSAHMIPVKLADFHPKYYNHIINQGVLYTDLFKPEGVAALAKALGPALCSLPTATDPRCVEVATKAARARDELVRSRDHRIVSLWEKHLADDKYPNTPVTFFIELCQYPDIAVDLSEKGKQSLVWALNRSPLLATAAYDDTSYLLDHDRRFESLKAPRKYRLVVFKDWEEAKAYLLYDKGYHKEATGKALTKNQLEQRRNKFEESVATAKAQLRFTTRSRIKNSAIFQYAHSLGEDYWDFGYVKKDETANAEFLFVSGFDSPSFVTDPSQLHSKAIRHLALYSKPHDDRYEVLRQPPYAALYGPLRGLFDVVDSLLNPSLVTNHLFVTKDNIPKLEETA